MWRYYDWIARLFRQEGREGGWLIATTVVLVLLYFLVLASACSPAEADDLTPVATTPVLTPIAVTEYGTGIYRWHDDELGVTCWVYNAYKEGGISCLLDYWIYPYTETPD